MYKRKRWQPGGCRGVNETLSSKPYNYAKQKRAACRGFRQVPLFVRDGEELRIDKYLSSVNLVKRRTVAQDMIKSGVVFINGVQAKASKDVSVGDRIEIRYLKGSKNYEVLKIPTTKTIPKSAKDEYVKELS